MKGFQNHFSGHAEEYARSRPTYPATLFAWLASLTTRRKIAWDCATGNGQAAVALAPFFDQVIATDASKTQIGQAQTCKNVSYRVAGAHDSGLEENSVDLITVAQAFHWFDFDGFLAEVKRVAATSAVIAIWCYELSEISPEVDAVLGEFYRGEIHPFWPPERLHIESCYRDVPFPFERLSVPEFTMELEWSADQLLSYLDTWSAVRRFTREKGRNPLDVLAPHLLKAWGSQETRKVRWPLRVLVGRVRK